MSAHAALAAGNDRGPRTLRSRATSSCEVLTRDSSPYARREEGPGTRKEDNRKRLKAAFLDGLGAYFAPGDGPLFAFCTASSSLLTGP